jgi:hypothetical protein
MLNYTIQNNEIICQDEDVVVSVTAANDGFTGYVKYLKENKVEVFEFPFISNFDFTETIKARIRVCVKRLSRKLAAKHSL